MNLYVYPVGKDRRMDFVAAANLATARKYHDEARKPERYELEAVIVHLICTDLLDSKGKPKRSAQPTDFGCALAADAAGWRDESRD